MAKFALGLDGGGTRTSAVLLDSYGSVVGNGIAGSSNRYVASPGVATSCLVTPPSAIPSLFLSATVWASRQLW